MPMLPNKYGDFSDLEKLMKIMASQHVVTAYGQYDASQPHPGPHIMFTSVESDIGFDFIKQADGTYIVCVSKHS